MESPSMDTVYQAIGALYDNPNASEKEKASLWLGDVQKSIHSWKIADELLQQKKDANSCYFAAQTMRSKVQHNLSELPPEAIVSLRDSLVSHLNRTSSETNSTILTQLSLALADLALQMPSWQNCISELIKSFSNKNDFALLEILTVLPQEIDSTSLKLGENRREEIKAELRTHANIVTMFLKESIASSQNTHVALKIVKCMTSWIQVKAINIQEVPQNAVIGFCLQVLRDHNSINILHEVASDCICALLHCLEENNNHENIERLLFESIASLEESYHMAVAHEEEEKAANYAKIFTELAETFLEKIIASMASGNTHFAMKSLELALICVGHHDYEVAEITFNLWYRLSEEIYQRDYQPLTDAFKPHIERLIEALARHCQCEPDLANLPEEGDEFYEFRMKVMGVIKDVVFIVGSSSVFRQMFATLDVNNSWEKTEAALFLMQSVAKSILPEEYEYVPKVVEAILSMPEDAHAGVRKTCLLLLGELCEWVQRHPACVSPALHALLRALKQPLLAPAAAVALQSICSTCRESVRTHVATLLEAARAADALSLPPATATTLLRAVAAAVGALPPPELSAALREAVSIQIAGLTTLLSSGAPVRKHSIQDPVLWLDRLAALFRDVDIPADSVTSMKDHPALPALADAWPVLRDTVERYGGDGRVAERWCRCVRFALRMGGRSTAALLPALAHALTALYLRHAHSAVLYLASVLVDELAECEECVPELIGLLQVLMPRTFNLLQEENGLRDNPDTVDDLFRLCIRFLQRCPVPLLSSSAAGAVVRCAALASSLDHREANASVMKFLHELARAAREGRQAGAVRDLAGSVLGQHGQEVTRAVLEASALHLRAYMLGDAAEVLLELVALEKARGERWLRAALRALPEGTPRPTPAQCESFHDAALRADKVKEMTRLLRDFAKLFR